MFHKMFQRYSVSHKEGKHKNLERNENLVHFLNSFITFNLLFRTYMLTIR